jgi:cell division protein FtsB
LLRFPARDCVAILTLVPYKDAAPFPKQMTIVIGLCVVGLMAFGLALSYYKNILFDQQLLTMQQRNATLQQQIAEGYQRFEYLQSRQYKDKYAKESIGLLNPGEKVVIFAAKPDPVVSQPASELSEAERQAIYEENLRNIRVLDHWRLFLFHRDQIDDLRKPI